MKNDELFQLVNSLSASEKRYFKRFSTIHDHTTKKDYLDLFHVLQSLDVYDEEEVKVKLRNKTFAKNLASGKNYLYNQLLRSLRSYYHQKKGRLQAYELLEEIYILYEKNLIPQALSRVRKAHKIIEKFRFSIVHLELMFIERILIRTYQQRDTTTKIKEHQTQTSQLIEEVINQFKVLELYDMIFLLTRDQMFSLSDDQLNFQKLQEYSGLEKSIGDQSFDTQMLYHLSFSNYYFLVKNFKGAENQMKKVLNIFDHFPYLVEEYPLRYINVINNYLNLFYLKGDFSPYPKYLKELEEFRPVSENVRIFQFQIKFTHKIAFYMGQGEYEEALTIIPFITKGLKKYGEKINTYFQLDFLQNIALIYFATENYDQALIWVNKIVNDKKQDIRQDIQRFNFILQIILQFELGNEELVLALARSIIRRKPSNENEQTEKRICEIFRELVRINDAKGGAGLVSRAIVNFQKGSVLGHREKGVDQLLQ